MKEKYVVCVLTLLLMLPMLFSVPALGDINSYISVKKYWENEGNYTILDRPDGLLSDGESMNTVAENGNYGNNYVEAIYLKTDKGLIAIDPSTGDKLREQPSSVLPADAGKMVCGPLIAGTLWNGSSTMLFTTDGGKLVAVRDRIDSWPLIPVSDVSPVRYSLLWMLNISSPNAVLSLYEGNCTWIVVGDESGRVMAVDMAGNIMWNRTMGFSVKDIGADERDGDVVVSNDTVCAALDAASGALKWTLTQNDRTTGLFIPRNYRYQGTGIGPVFGTLDGKLIEVDMQDGSAKRAIKLMEGRPITGIGDSLSGKLYASVNTEENGMGRVYCISGANIEWYQNITGIPGNPVYIPLMGAVFVTTDAGMFYSLNNGNITGRMHLNDSYLFAPLFSEYVPLFMDGAFFLFSRNGGGYSFSDKIIYSGEPAEVLNAKPVSSVKIPWKVGQTWAYKWYMNFSNIKNYILPHSGTSAGESHGLFLKMAYITYKGEDKNGLRFEYRGGTYAEGSVTLDYIWGSDMDIRDTNYIHQYSSSFSGNFWARPYSYNDSSGQHFYFGMLRDVLNMSIEYNITGKEMQHGSYTRTYFYRFAEKLSLNNVSIRYRPEIAFLPADNESFKDLQRVNIKFSGNIFGFFGLGWGDSTSNISMNKKNISSKPGEYENTTVYLSFNSTNPKDIRFLSIFLRYDSLSEIFNSPIFFYSWEYPLWNGNYDGSFYENISITPNYKILPIFCYYSIPTVLVNSTATTPQEVNSFLSDEYAYAHGAPRESRGDTVLTAIVMFSIAFLVLAALFVMGYRNKERR